MSRRERAADESRGAGEPDRERPRAARRGRGVHREVVHRDAMAVAEHALEFAARVARAESAEDAERQRAVDRVLEHSRSVLVFEAVRVIPARKRAREQHVAEARAGDDVAVLDLPAAPERRRLERDARAFAERPAAGEHARGRERRVQALERAGPGVPGEGCARRDRQRARGNGVMTVLVGR